MARETTITNVKHVPDLFGHDPSIQALVGVAYGLGVAGLLIWSVRRGMQKTGFSFHELMTHANDELTIKYYERFYETKGDASKDHNKETEKNGLGDVITEGA